MSDLAQTMSLATAVAFSIDYNLFILTRYKEEIKIHSDKIKIVSNVIHMSRHTVMVSGIIIMICFIFDMLFQNDILTSCGISAAVTVFFCILINLTLTPVMLLTFHDFFYKCKHSDFKRIRRYWNNDQTNYNSIENCELRSEEEINRM